MKKLCQNQQEVSFDCHIESDQALMNIRLNKKIVCFLINIRVGS